MDRRAFILTAASSLLAAPLTAEAQQTAKIGYLTGSSVGALDDIQAGAG
jgi:hypothetical protein